MAPNLARFGDISPNLATWRLLLRTPEEASRSSLTGPQLERYIKGQRALLVQFLARSCEGRSCVKRSRIALEKFANRLPSLSPSAVIVSILAC